MNWPGRGPAVPFSWMLYVSDPVQSGVIATVPVKSKSRTSPAGMGVPGIPTAEIVVPEPVIFPELSMLNAPMTVTGDATALEPDPVGTVQPSSANAHVPLTLLILQDGVKNHGCAERTE